MNKLISPAHSRKLGRPGKGSRSAEFPVSFTPAHATPFVPRSRAPPANVVDFFRRKKARTREFCRKFGNPGDSSPLPGSSTYFHHFSILFLSLSLYFFFGSGPPFLDRKKKSRSFLPRATWYFVVSFFFLLFFWTFTTPRLLIFHPSIRTPLYDGPCPASGNVRFFLSLSFSALPPMEICTNFRRDGGWTVEKKKVH